MANFTYTVGPNRTYATLQAAWNALPATVPVGDLYTFAMQSGLHTVGLDCSAAAKTVSGEVIVQPEAGASWWELYPALNHALNYDNTVGVAVEAAPFGRDVFTLQSNVNVTGMQIKPGGACAAIGTSGVGYRHSRNLITMVGAAAFTSGAGVEADIFNNVIVTTSTTIPPININDTTGKIVNIVGNTIIAPNGGAGEWFAGVYGTGTAVKDNNIFGFTAATSTRINTAGSSNNATDMAALYGTSNLTSVTAANQFVNPASDLRPKTGAAIIGAGITSALIPTDVFGATRPGSPTIGAAEPAAIATDTTAPILTSPTGVATGNTTASASVTTNEAGGTIWCLTNTAATATVAAVKAGTSQAVAAVGVQSFASRAGLTPDTLYYNHFVQDDAATPTPNTSAVANSSSFRTPGAVTFSGPVATRNSVLGSAASFNNASYFASAFTLTYSLQAGTLPPGITLNAATGVTSGTPTTAGTYSGIVIRATDTNGNTADTNAYSHVVAATNASPTFPGTIANITGTGGAAITPVNVSGQFADTDTLTYSASPAGTAWPAGLVVNSATGIISGTVATSTTTGLKVRATDTASQTVDSNAFSATLTAGGTVTFTCDLPLARAASGAARASVVVRASVLGRGTDTPIATFGSNLTLNASGLPPPFSIAGAVAGTVYPVKYTNVTDPLDCAIVNLMAV